MFPYHHSSSFVGGSDMSYKRIEYNIEEKRLNTNMESRVVQLEKDQP